MLQATAQQELEKTTVTVKSVAEILRKLNPSKQLLGFEDSVTSISRVTTIADLVSVVASYFQISPEELVGQVRKKEIMIPRQVCMYLARRELSQSFERIGEELGGRNHTTVMHACDKVVRRIKKDRKLLMDINAIKKEMGL